jgi:hypothetical protein
VLSFAFIFYTRWCETYPITVAPSFLNWTKTPRPRRFSGNTSCRRFPFVAKASTSWEMETRSTISRRCWCPRSVHGSKKSPRRQFPRLVWQMDLNGQLAHRPSGYQACTRASSGESRHETSGNHGEAAKPLGLLMCYFEGQEVKIQILSL